MSRRSIRFPVDELTRLAFIYAEQDREAFVEACGNQPEGKEAAELVKQLRKYRTKRWGKTQYESDIENADVLDVRSGRIIKRRKT